MSQFSRRRVELDNKRAISTVSRRGRWKDRGKIGGRSVESLQETNLLSSEL